MNRQTSGAGLGLWPVSFGKPFPISKNGIVYRATTASGRWDWHTTTPAIKPGPRRYWPHYVEAHLSIGRLRRSWLVFWRLDKPTARPEDSLRRSSIVAM